MLDQLIKALPKSVLAILVMVIALFTLRQLQPPRTICDAQLEIFKDSQKAFLYPSDPVGGISRSSLYKRLADQCNVTNDPGGCMDLFDYLKRVTVDLRNIPDVCGEQAETDAHLSAPIWSTMELMIKIAWGDRAPASYSQRNGWLDNSELTLFCDLRHQSIRLFGKEKFNIWQEKMLTTMPNAGELERDKIWQRNILSTNCELYK